MTRQIIVARHHDNPAVVVVVVVVLVVAMKTTGVLCQNVVGLLLCSGKDHAHSPVPQGVAQRTRNYCTD